MPNNPEIGPRDPEEESISEEKIELNQLDISRSEEVLERATDDDNLKEREEKLKQDDANELKDLRREMEEIYDGKKLENKNSKENIEVSGEKNENLAEAMKEVDGFFKEVNGLHKIDSAFVDRGRTLVAKLIKEGAEGNPRDLLYRPVAKITEKAVPALRSRLKIIEGYKDDVDEKKRDNIENLLQQATDSTDADEAKKYIERATDLFEELMDKAQDTREDKGQERKKLFRASEENNEEARREKIRADKTLGRGGYGIDIKSSIIGRYSSASNVLVDFIGIESKKIDKQDQSFEAKNQERKKIFKQMVEAMLK